MQSIVTNVAVWRRLLLVGITALTALLALSATAPQEAHAVRDPTVVLTDHEGWVQVRSTGRPATCSLTGYCSEPPQRAYRWTGYAWQEVRLPVGIQVYAYPYSAPWHWVWTRTTGWLALRTAQLDTGYRCEGPRCPIF